MSEPVSSEIAPATLEDPWERGPAIPLDGPLERARMAPLLSAFLGLIACFILFQVVIGPIATFGLLFLSGISFSDLLQDMPAVLEQHARALIASNSIGLVLGVAVPAYLFARLHTTRPRAFLRLRGSDLPMLALSVIGLFALIPVVQWLGMVNGALPLPDFIREFDETQMALIEQVLSNDLGFLFSLTMLALTPAICEELFFRGYVQRHAERSMGVVGGILFAGIIFGLYHIRLTQVLPLSALGVYMAYLSWRTGSLWAPMVVHFANNAFSVVLGIIVSSRGDMNLEDVENMNIPWYVTVLGAVFFGLAVYGLHYWGQTQLAQRRAAEEPTADLHMQESNHE